MRKIYFELPVGIEIEGLADTISSQIDDLELHLFISHLIKAVGETGDLAQIACQAINLMKQDPATTSSDRIAVQDRAARL